MKNRREWLGWNNNELFRCAVSKIKFALIIANPQDWEEEELKNTEKGYTKSRKITLVQKEKSKKRSARNGHASSNKLKENNNIFTSKS